jgi:hypothetical protein
MAEIWYDVDTALAEVPVNKVPLVDDTDFKSIEAAIAYNAAGLALYWHFVTTAGAYSVTAVTPTTGGNYDWTDQGDAGVYTIEIPASGGASINNDTEGFGWFTGVATGVLPWCSPIYGFRAAGLNNLLIDDAYSTTRGLSGTALPAAAADAAGGLAISNAGGLDLDAIKTQTDKLGHGDYGIDKLVRSTTPANTLTVGATGLVAVPDTQKVDVETIKTRAITCAAGVTVLANLGFAGAPGANNGAPTTNGTKLNQTADLTAGQSIACSDKTGFSLSATGADLILKSSTFVQAIVAAVNEFATYGLTALNTLLVTTGIKAASIPAATLAANQDVRNVSGTLPDVTLAASQPNYAPATASALDAVDNFVDTEVAAIKAVTDKLDTAVVLDGAVYKFTANALEEAPTGGSAPTAAAIRQEIDSNSTQLAAIVADTNELQTDLVNGGRLDLLIDGIKAKTDNLPSDPADESAIEAAITAATSPLAKPGDKMDIVDAPNATAVTAIQNGLSKPATAQTITPPTDMALNSTVMKAADYTAPPTVDQIHDEVVEGTLTFRKIMKILLSFAAGKSTGGGTATISFNDNADTKARITATTDTDGNRTAVTLDGD